MAKIFSKIHFKFTSFHLMAKKFAVSLWSKKFCKNSNFKDKITEKILAFAFLLSFFRYY